MSKTADEIRTLIPAPWIVWTEAETICVKYGLGATAWRKMQPGILAREPDHIVRSKRYSREDIIRIIESSLPQEA